MDRGTLALLATLASATLPNAPGLATEPTAQLEPTGPWKLEYLEKRCMLSRAFGTVTTPRTFALVSDLGKNYVDLTVVDAAEEGHGDRFDGALTIGGRPPEKVKVQVDYLPAQRQRVSRARIVDAAATALRTAEAVGISGRGFATVFHTRGLAKAYAALDTCVRDLEERVGFDPALRAAVVTPATIDGDIARQFGADNYPPDARRAKQEGRAAVILTVETSGAVSACRVIESSGSPSLDAKTCELFHLRARFTPALDKAQKPIRSQYWSAVNWMLEH